MTVTCKVCGRFLYFADAEIAPEVYLSHGEYRVVQLLKEAPMSPDALIDRIYDRVDGGPRTAKTVLYVTISRLNKKLKLVGKQVRFHKRKYYYEDARGKDKG